MAVKKLLFECLGKAIEKVWKTLFSELFLKGVQALFIPSRNNFCKLQPVSDHIFPKLPTLGGIVSPQIPVCLEPQNESLFGNKNFADLIG